MGVKQSESMDIDVAVREVYTTGHHEIEWKGVGEQLWEKVDIVGSKEMSGDNIRMDIDKTRQTS